MRALLPITAGLALLLTSCATTGELAPRHAPSGLATPLPQADFAAYVSGRSSQHREQQGVVYADSSSRRE